MKIKYFIESLLIMVLISVSFAEEAILLNVSSLPNAKLDLTSEAKELGYTTDEQLSVVTDIRLNGDWCINFSTSANTSSNRNNASAEFKAGVSKAFGDVIVAHATLPDYPSTFSVEPLYPLSLNEPNVGLGYINNIAEIKSIKVGISGINRDDDVFIIYTDNSGKHYQKMTKATQRINGAETCVWDNPSYIDDPRKRDINVRQSWPKSNAELKFDGFLIRSAHGGDVAFGFSNVSIIYDKAYVDTEDDIDFESLFGLNAVSTKKERLLTAREIINRELGINTEKERMAVQGTESEISETPPEQSAEK